MKKAEKDNKVSKKNFILGIVAILLVAVVVICGFLFIPGEKVSKNLDVNADTSAMLMSAEQAVSGGTTQNVVDEFSEEIKSAVLTVNG